MRRPLLPLLSTRHNIYSSAMAGGVATPPMLIVFHDKYTTLDPLWHVRHMGKIVTHIIVLVILHYIILLLSILTSSQPTIHITQ